MAVAQAGYEIRAGEMAPLEAPADTLDFLLSAQDRRIEIQGPDTAGIIAGPNSRRDQFILAPSPLAPPGEYAVKISATSPAGEQRDATLAITVKDLQTVPKGATRPPVVLLNGWQNGITGSCNPSAVADTFGNLDQYLLSDGVPVVYFFDNCVVDPSQAIETLGNDLANFLKTIKYDDGTQVTQIDLVAFSLGGLIARSYLAGLQTDGSLNPPTATLVRKLILIATPNFGSFVVGNYASVGVSNTQNGELIPGSSFLWDLSTWNQRGDDLRGVDALAIIGNAGTYQFGLNATAVLNNASDGLVSLTSAALGFATPDATPTQIVPYCQVDPSAYTNTIYGTYLCNAPGIANVNSTSQYTGQIVRSFLAGTTDWKSIGGTPAKDQYLSTDGGMYFAMVNSTNSYVSDITAVQWGNVTMTQGGTLGSNLVYYADFISGTSTFTVTSTSQGTVTCAKVVLPAGYTTSARCKISTAIFSVGPLNKTPGRVVSAGGTITLTGYGFADTRCGECQVLATPSGSSQQTALQVVSWSNTAISVTLPSSMTGLITILVKASYGSDAITIMAAVPPATPAIAASPSSLTFSYTPGGSAPPSQSIQITNSGAAGTLDWTATASAAWLTVSPASGTAPSTLTVSIVTSGLKSGTYNGNVQIASKAASNSPLTVPVTFTVGASAAALAVTPNSFNFTYTFGGATPAAQNVSIGNSGGGALTWTASASTDWIALSSASGTAPASLSVSVKPANLAAGQYSGNVTITAAGATGSPASVTVTLTVTGTQAAPSVSALTNGASFQKGFASATWVSIFGTNLSATTATWGPSDFTNDLLPTSLDGVSVTIDGVPAYVEYISPTQINVLAPDHTQTGTVQVQLKVAGQTSSISGEKQQFAPAWFTFDNGKYVAAQHADYSIVSTTAPAKVGETILLYGTGFGPTNPPVPTSKEVTSPENLPNMPQITIGGQSATVRFAGLVASGLYQFNVVVPNVPNGDAAVVAQIGGVSTQAGVSVTVGQ